MKVWLLYSLVITPLFIYCINSRENHPTLFVYDESSPNTLPSCSTPVRFLQVKRRNHGHF